MVLRRFLLAIFLFSLLGTIIFHFFITKLEGRVTLLDTVYFIIVGTLTIGYGDIKPVSDNAKVRAQEDVS